MRTAVMVTLAVGITLFGAVPLQAEEELLLLAAFNDKDNDGIKNRDDLCPDEPEDVDHYKDNDGCPEPDNDNDGVLDGMDKCPLEPEDQDGFEDQDGCPDPDNDGDRIPDRMDKCPNQAEDFDGYDDADGCPDGDNDNDGIPDASDQCPNDLEDKDGHQDSDGCPDIDNDNDGIPDQSDQCPNQAEVMNGIKDTDGCPDESAPQIPMGKILLDQVRFVGRSSSLTMGAYAALDSLAQSLMVYPETELDIVGHVDRSGEPGEDYQLAQAMAQTVADYLIQKGVGAERLNVTSMGSTRPIASNVTPENREENRRIEIMRIR